MKMKFCVKKNTTWNGIMNSKLPSPLTSTERITEVNKDIF